MYSSQKKSIPRADWSQPSYVGTLTRAQAEARRKVVETAAHEARRLAFVFDIQHDHAPALRSVIDEMSIMIAGRFGGKNTAAQEHALTQAAVALGNLRKEVFSRVPQGDANYKSAHE